MPKKPDDEEALTQDILRLARQYGRYGYKKITSLLQTEGWRVNHKRVKRIWKTLENTVIPSGMGIYS